MYTQAANLRLQFLQDKCETDGIRFVNRRRSGLTLSISLKLRAPFGHQMYASCSNSADTGREQLSTKNLELQDEKPLNIKK